MEYIIRDRDSYAACLRLADATAAALAVHLGLGLQDLDTGPGAIRDFIETALLDHDLDDDEVARRLVTALNALDHATSAAYIQGSCP